MLTVPDTKLSVKSAAVEVPGDVQYSVVLSGTSVVVTVNITVAPSLTVKIFGVTLYIGASVPPVIVLTTTGDGVDTLIPAALYT